MLSGVRAMAFYQHSSVLCTVYISLHITSLPKPSEPAILSSLKKPLCAVPDRNPGQLQW